MKGAASKVLLDQPQGHTHHDHHHHHRQRHLAASSLASRQELITSLRDPDIERIMHEASRQIQRDARVLGVPARTLATQVRLHLPRLSRKTLQERGPKANY